MTEELLRRALRYRWLIFFILAFGYALVFFHRLCPAVVAVDMMADLGASGTLLGILSSAYFYPYAAMQLPAGLLSDSWGPRRTVAVFSLVAFVGSVLLGLAQGISWAIGGRLLVGLGVSMVFVPTMKILAEWFTVREFSRMTAILMAVGALGTFSAASPLAALSGWIGWRMSFAAVGVLSLVLALMVWVFVRDRPEHLGWPQVTDTRGAGSAAIGLAQGVRQVLTQIPFWVIGAWFFFGAATMFSFGGLWGGPYMQHVHGLSKSEAGQILSLWAVGTILGSALVSLTPAAWLGARKRILIAAGSLSVVLISALALFTQAIPVPALYAVCLGFGVAQAAMVIFGYTVIKELFPLQIAGTATGLANLFPFAGGAVFQPLVGYILERYRTPAGVFSVAGYQTAFSVLLCCSVTSLALIVCLKDGRQTP